MRKVLIITYHFPPRPTIGSVRLGGLAKYLREFGWEPVILTAKLPGDPDPRFEVIQTQYRDVVCYWKGKLGLHPDKMARQQLESDPHKGYKSKLIKGILNLGEDIVAYPDKMKGWYSFAVEAGDRILQQNSIDAVISSSNPVTSHLIARQLKAKWNITWVADLRDIWTQDDDYTNNHKLVRRLFERRLELHTLSKADALVTVSGPLVEKLRALHKTENIYEIPNGFDPEEMKQTSSRVFTGKFTITHTGSLYNCMRDPSNLFQAIRDLVSEGAIRPSDIQVRFYGHPERCLEKQVQYYGVQRIVKHYGLIPREASLEKQRESQLLLLLNWANYPAIGTYTGKVFEYLAAQRPILSIGKAGGVIEDLLRETGAGIYAPTVSEIKSFLKKCYSEFKSKGAVAYEGQESKIYKYSHREMARSFSEVLNSPHT